MDEHLPVRFLDALAMLLIVFDDAIRFPTFDIKVVENLGPPCFEGPVGNPSHICVFIHMSGNPYFPFPMLSKLALYSSSCLKPIFQKCSCCNTVYPIFWTSSNFRAPRQKRNRGTVMGLGRLVKKVCCFANARKIAHAEKWRGG